MILQPSDLAPFADIDPVKAAAMIEDVEARAIRVAPCLASTTDPAILAAARAILRGAVLRWNDAGSGALQNVQSGPFSLTVDNRASRGALLWDSEVRELQALCGVSRRRGAFSVDTMPAPSTLAPNPWSSP